MVEPCYIALTHCKNEEKTISRCVESVLNQTIPPEVYVIVDDGSTDETPMILRGFEGKIVVVTLDSGRLRGRGDHHRNLLLVSYREAVRRVKNWSYLLTIDADEILLSDYMERLIAEMEEDNRLGITSGVPLSRVGDGYRKIYRGSRNVWNGARVYRRGCWEDIGMIPGVQGWDLWAQLEANRFGWRTKPFNSINFLEERPWGRPTIRSWIRRGFTRRRLGYSTITHLITCVTRISHRPFILGALAFLLSFLLFKLGSWNYFNEEYYDFARRYTKNIARGWLTTSKLKEKGR